MTVSLFLRLLRGGGRAGGLRFVLMLIGTALGAAAVLLAVSLPGVIGARAERAAARLPVNATSPSQATYSYVVVEDSVGERPWTRILVAGRPGSPVPPGLSALPAPGETVASPALAEAARRSAAVQRRLGRVTAVISPPGLQGPDEAISYTGVRESDLENGISGGSFGAPLRSVPDAQSARGVAAELLVLVGGPALLFLVTCARLSATTRTRRLAALRLVGMGQRQLVTLAGLESALTGLLGAVLGLVFYAIVNSALAGSSQLSFRWFSQDSALGLLGSCVFVLVVTALSYRVGVVGTRRVLADTVRSRRDEHEGVGSLLRLVPFFTGISLLATFLVLAAATDQHVSVTATNAIAAGTLLATGGLLLLLRPLASRVAGVLAPRAPTTAVRLGARRVQHESSSLVRVTTGLVLLVMVAGIGVALLQDAALAAGVGATRQIVEVGALDVEPGARERVAALPAEALVVAVHSDVDTTPGMDTGTPESYARYRGATIFYIPCERLRGLLEQGLEGCRDDRTYRLVDADPRAPATQLGAGLRLPVTGADGARRFIDIPDTTLGVDRLTSSWILHPDTILITSDSTPPGGWPDQSTFRFILSSTGGQLEHLQDELAAAAPSAQLTRASVDLSAVEAYRVHRGALQLGVSAGLLLGVVAFLVAAVDRAHEQRRAVTSLMVLGVPGRTMRQAQAVQLLLPLLLGLGLAVLVSHLAANAYLASGGLQQGVFLPSLGYSATMAVGAAIVAAAGACLVPGIRPQAQELRRP